MRSILTCFLLLVPISVAGAQLQLARIEGVILDGRGLPIGGAIVVLTDPLGAELVTSAADTSGRFSFHGVSPGRYTLRAIVAGLPPFHLPLSVSGGVPLEVTVRLPSRLTDNVVVEGSFVHDHVASRAGVAGESISQVPVRLRGRGLQDLISTLPGWRSEDNGLLHARGVDDGFLFVIDGVPVYERLDVLSGIAPDLASVESVNVMTGYVPPEFGQKAGGVIEIRSPLGDRAWTAEFSIGAASDRTLEVSTSAGGGVGDALRLRLDAAVHRSDRFLDPVHPDNLHNAGRAINTSGQIGWSGQRQDQVTATWGIGRSRFEVPHGDEQEDAAQDQRQHIGSDHLNVSWQRTMTRGTVANLAGYGRRSTADLLGSENDTPIFAQARRSFVRGGVLASVMHQAGAHLLKAGLEAQHLSLHEQFGFAITDIDEARETGFHDAALAFDRTNPFSFTARATPNIWSTYVQDSWQGGSRLTVSGGVRLDRSRLLLARSQWSPRVGVAIRAAETTLIRASVSRFFQPPQPENLLLSSSPQARSVSPFADDRHEGGDEVEPERQWAYELGVERQFSSRIRLDFAYWYRRASEVADPNVFLGTTLIFPNAVARGRAHGVDLRLEMPRVRSWSGYVSGSIARVRQVGPITGGLFLEEEAGEIGPGVEFTPDHDQRFAAAAGFTWHETRSDLALSIGARFETGTPLQREDEDAAELAARPGAERVDFDNGRVKPRAVVSLLTLLPLRQTTRTSVTLRGQILNLFNDGYAYNFGNPFSGTHFGAPRSGSLSLEIGFK